MANMVSVEGVNPMKLTALLSFAVPDLPAIVLPIALAARPVPYWMVPSIALTTSPVRSLEHLLRGGWRLVQFRPLAALHAGDDVQRRLLAWLAMVEKPRAMSIMLRPELPSVT